MLKITFLKNIYFFRPTSIGDGGGGNDDFFLTIRVFLRFPHPYWSVKKKNCKTKEKHRRYGQKHFTSKNPKNVNTLQNNVQFILYFKNWLGAAAGQPEYSSIIGHLPLLFRTIYKTSG